MKRIIEEALKRLGNREQIFHSEAEFQFKLAWEIKEANSDISIDFEFPFELGIDNTTHRSEIDLILKNSTSSCAIELKYAKGELEYNGYDLRGKPSDECHEILKDILRMEKYKTKMKKASEAYVLVIANNTSYWKRPSEKVKNAKDMYLTQGITMKPGLYEYRKGSILQSHTKLNIELSNSYTIDWKDYCTIPAPKNFKFKYLLLEVK